MKLVWGGEVRLVARVREVLLSVEASLPEDIVGVVFGFMWYEIHVNDDSSFYVTTGGKDDGRVYWGDFNYCGTRDWCRLA